MDGINVKISSNAFVKADLLVVLLEYGELTLNMHAIPILLQKDKSLQSLLPDDYFIKTN